MWARLKTIPLGVWLALSTALTILFLALKGRRIEIELAHTKAALEAARAHAESSKKRANAVELYAETIRHAQRIEELEAARALVRASGAENQKRLAALPPEQIQIEYLKLAERKRLARIAEEKRFGRARRSDP